MIATEVKSNIFAITVNDRTTDLFEGLWPITQEGVTYNSYLIKDEKNVLIDLTKEFKTDTLFDYISEIVSLQEIDYLVLNHMEPDHTGAMKTLARINPDVTIICSKKAVPMLENYYGVVNNIKAVDDGEELNIGSRTLKFFMTPFVHWPETMMTYDMDNGVLFSCDGFGGYGALPGNIFDSDCHDHAFYEKESLRYYANIVSKFAKNTLAAINKLGALDISVICPSHGLIWRENPGRIIELYTKWSKWGTEKSEPGVTLLYASMYGNTEAMMNAFAKGLSASGLPVNIFDVSRTHASYILPSIWQYEGVIIGAPTYEVGLFPAMTQILEEISIKKMTGKKAVFFGSYGWSGGALKKVKQTIEPLKWELVDDLEFLGAADEKMMNKGFELGRSFAESLK